VRILISNDDGYRARGIHALREALRGLGDLTIVAPDRNRSGASNSLTLEVPLRVEQADVDVYFVQGGTPTDCVHLAISGLFPFEPDMVVSGVNDGSNLGDDVLYSGTVAAATEGRFLGKPAVAVSLNTDGLRGDAVRHFATAAHYARVIVERLMSTPLVFQMGRATLLNVNVPNLPLNEVKGIKVTRLGNRHRSEAVIRAEDPRGRPVYWVGPAGPSQDAGEGTDFHAVYDGYVSVTPLTVDLTNHDALGALRTWFGKPA
jgi:5'-nucleotidase